MEYDHPLSYYVESDTETLTFHLFDVGEGLMCLIVFPDETTMLFDCNIKDGSESRILELLSKNIPNRYDEGNDEFTQWIDIYVNSHRDIDHMRGLDEVVKQFPIKAIWDLGQAGSGTENDDYSYYMSLRRNIKEKYGDDAVIVPVPSSVPLRNFGGAQVFCLSSSGNYEEKKAFMSFSAYEFQYMLLSKKAKIQHGNSIVLTIQFAGRSLMLTGDSDWLAWRDDIIPNFQESGLLKTNIFIASHHGSRSFFTDEVQNENVDPDTNPNTTYINSIKYVKPSITLIPCGDYAEKHHPNNDTLKILKKYTSNEQVYTTYDKGTLTGFIDEFGTWTVAPIRFAPRSNINRPFYINCFYQNNGTISGANSGKGIPLDTELHFQATSKYGILEPISDVSVTWEVSNGGINDDHEHQEIYYKKDNEKGGERRILSIG